MSARRGPVARDPYQRMLAIGFAVSAFLHVAAFVALAYAPESDRSKLMELRAASIQTYSVDAEALVPPAPPKKQIPEPAPPPPAAKKIPVEKPPEPKKVEKPPEPKKAEPKKVEKKPPKERTEADTQALIERLRKKREAEAEETAFLGTTTNPGETSTVSSGVCDLQMQIYVSEIQGRVRNMWVYPGLDRLLETGIEVRISQSGELLSTRVDSRSGDTLFDESVRRALSKATPFPPFPTCVKASQFKAVLRFRSEDLG